MLRAWARASTWEASAARAAMLTLALAATWALPRLTGWRTTAQLHQQHQQQQTARSSRQGRTPARLHRQPPQLRLAPRLPPRPLPRRSSSRVLAVVLLPPQAVTMS
jgi:hypothetical protein